MARMSGGGISGLAQFLFTSPAIKLLVQFVLFGLHAH